MTVKELLDAAMSLSPADRESLIEQLIASLVGDKDFAIAEIEGAWSAEIARRSIEIDNGTADLVDWSEVRARIAQRPSRR